MRMNVYIDGFNLYYGALRGGPNKWLNLQDYFTRLRQADSIEQIYYFSALVTGNSRAKQETYLKALATLPKVNVVLGRFKQKQVFCTVAPCTHSGHRIFQMPEEKHTDVNIAVQMLDDAYQGACEGMILVSGDSDLVPGVNRVKLRYPNIQVHVYVPTRNATRGAAVELRSTADRNRNLPLDLLRVCQFSQQVPDGAGGMISKPGTW